MTTEQDTAPEADDTTEQSGSPAQTVRVPNVNPGAKSGLDHTVIGSDALASPEDDGDQDAEPEGELAVPDGELDAQIEWVAGASDQASAKERADAVFTKAEAGGADAATLESLAGALRIAVYGSAPNGDPVPGEVVDSETAGTGDAMNADTGEVTPSGQPLPPVDPDATDADEA